MAGLYISIRWFEILARRKRRISSSVFPLNIEPQITSIHPRCAPFIEGSINIIKTYSCKKNPYYLSPQIKLPKVEHCMERVGAFRSKLQEQYQQHADNASLLVTVQMLL